MILLLIPPAFIVLLAICEALVGFVEDWLSR